MGFIDGIDGWMDGQSTNVWFATYPLLGRLLPTPLTNGQESNLASPLVETKSSTLRVHQLYHAENGIDGYQAYMSRPSSTDIYN